MDRTKQREIASKGGKAAHQKGTAHEWTSEEAREAGRKGGMASHRRKQGEGGAAESSEMTETNRSTESGEMRGASPQPSRGPMAGDYGDDDMQ